MTELRNRFVRPQLPLLASPIFIVEHCISFTREVPGHLLPTSTGAARTDAVGLSLPWPESRLVHHLPPKLLCVGETNTWDLGRCVELRKEGTFFWNGVSNSGCAAPRAVWFQVPSAECKLVNLFFNDIHSSSIHRCATAAVLLCVYLLTAVMQ